MPEAGCHRCGGWAPRREWATPPGEPFPFRIACPNCGEEVSVRDVGYRLTVSPPAAPPPAGVAPPSDPLRGSA